MSSDLQNTGVHDPLFQRAINIVVYTQQVSASLLQRKLKIGYMRAAELVLALEESDVVSAPEEDTCRRKVLMPQLPYEKTILDW